MKNPKKTGLGVYKAMLMAFSCAVIVLCSDSQIFAQTSQWTGSAGDQLWGSPGNWSAGVPDGASQTADFSAFNVLPPNATVHLDSTRTIGAMIFADSDTNTPGSWVLDNNGSAGNTLTLGGSPTVITVTN